MAERDGTAEAQAGIGASAVQPAGGRALAAVVDGAEARIRLRLAPADARYAGGLVPGSKTMEIFADLETELALIEGGDEGLCAAYHGVEFLAPLRVGDFVDAVGRVTGRGRTSRLVELELYKVVEVGADGVGGRLDPPVLAARATATIVVAAGPG